MFFPALKEEKETYFGATNFFLCDHTSHDFANEKGIHEKKKGGEQTKDD